MSAPIAQPTSVPPLCSSLSASLQGLSAFTALMDQVVPRIRPVPPFSGSPGFNAECANWMPGDPIPPTAICMTQVSLAEMGEYRRLREDASGPSEADLITTLLLASLCDANGTLFSQKPPTLLAYSKEEIQLLGSRISPDLAMHILTEIQFFNGWLRRKEGNAAEEAAKNS